MATEGANFPAETTVQQALNPVTIDQLIKNQARELELRAHELDLQQQQDRHNFEFAKESLNAQAQDRRDDRLFQRRQRRNAYIFAGVLAVLIASLIVSAMWLNKDQVALEIIKSIVLLLSGGGAGYAIGRYQAQANPALKDDES